MGGWDVANFGAVGIVGDGIRSEEEAYWAVGAVDG